MPENEKMEVNYDVIISLATGLKLYSNEEYPKFSEAFEFLGKNSSEWNGDLQQLQAIISQYVLEKHPELSLVHSEIMEQETVEDRLKIHEQYRSQYKDSYEIEPVPTDRYTNENKKN